MNQAAIENGTTQGGGFMFLLFIVFLILKLTNVITWSWWWVTAPLWAGLALGLAFGVIFIIIGLILIIIKAMID